MRYWWVNQNQTYKAEVSGGYLWSPKRKKKGARNQFYENMRAVAPGDIVFSYCDQVISTLGVATSYCYDSPKPTEFKAAGSRWGNDGWKVDVRYDRLDVSIRPKEHIDRIRPFLPAKYSPLRQSGKGLELYLAELSDPLGPLLLDLLRTAGSQWKPEPVDLLADDRRAESTLPAEDDVESSIRDSLEIESTVKEQIVLARRGQGRFRQNVKRIESSCRVTGVQEAQFLIASHIKPWRVSTNAERLDGHNGLLLSPNIDFLFDRGFISFADNGTVLISPVVDRDCLHRLGIKVDHPISVGTFLPKQREYLAHHRRNVFLEPGRSK